MFSTPRFITIITVPILTGTLSFCASLGLIISILFYSKLKLTRVVRRILFGFCIYDCIYSVCAALSVAMLPKETSDYALGNLTTCDIQGFLQQLGGLGCIFYNLSLSVYYVAIMKLHMKEKEIAKKLEFWIHLIPNAFAIISSIFLYAKRQYAPLPNQHLCWVGTYPQGCLDDDRLSSHELPSSIGNLDDNWECIRGDKFTAYYAEFLLVIPFFVVYLFIFIIMIIILHSIYTTKKKSDKWKLREKSENTFFRKILERGRKKSDTLIAKMSVSKDRSDSLTANMCTSTGQGTSLMNATSRSGTKQDPLAFDVRKVKKQIRRESKLDYNVPIVLSSMQKCSATQEGNSKQSLRPKRASTKSKQEARAKLASQQCLLYMSSFLLCFIFTAVARIYGIVGREAPFPLLLLARFFHPSQGVFFILVYCRPHVKSIRAQNSELTWLQAFWIAFKGGGDNDNCDQTSLVVDKEGIDVPRLPDAERQRRQEIVRQQFKRRSVTYKPSSFDINKLNSAKEAKGLDLMIALGCDPSDEQIKEIEEGFGRAQEVDLKEKGLDFCDKPQ